MQIGITGGAGFIGSRLSRALIAGGHSVSVLDNLHRQVHPTGERPSDLDDAVGLFVGDVTEPGDWDAWFAESGVPEIVVHLAAETGTGQSLHEASRHGRVNVVGTTELLDAYTRHQVAPQQVLLASSRAVYGEGQWSAADGTAFYPPMRDSRQLEAAQWDPLGPDGQPARPLAHRFVSVEPRPTNVYAATKLAQEHILSAWCGAHDTSLTILRLQNVYGPGQSVTNSYTGVLTFFANQLARGEGLNVYEDGQIIRDFVFVDDVVAAFVAAVGAPATRADIGSGQPMALIDVAEQMSAIANGPKPAITGAFRHGDVRAAWADIVDATTQLAWRPSKAPEAGLRDLIEWVGAQT